MEEWGDELPLKVPLLLEVTPGRPLGEKVGEKRKEVKVLGCVSVRG